MAKKILFILVVFFTNIIQGITGFAGTMLAMPPSVMLVGFDTAKPILNALGLLSGIYIVAANRKSVNKKEFLKIVAVMTVSMLAGFALRNVLAGRERVMYILLGTVVILTAAWGIYKSFLRKGGEHGHGKAVSALLLVSAGVTHGMFVCGGPLLVSYMTGKVSDKQEFRATLSACWIVLNGIILADDIRTGLWNKDLLLLFGISAAILFAAMFIGSLLCKKMSRRLFMKITYVLLIVSGALLFIK